MNLRLKQIIDTYIGKGILFLNLVAVRGAGLILRRNHRLTESPEHIMVIKILGLGSVIMASDSINSVKQKYPGAKLILLCGKGVKAGIAPLGLFDEIRTIDDKNIFAMVSSALGNLWYAWGLKKLWIMDLEVYSVLTTIFSSWTCAINRFGFQLDKTNFRNYLNTHNVYFNQFIRVGINYAKLAEAMGVTEHKPFMFPARFNKNETAKNVIVINNTCSELGGYLRKLPETLLAALCHDLLANTTFRIALVGAPSDHQEVQHFLESADLVHERVLNVAGKFGFDDYYTFIGSEAKCMLSIDSAPLHIAHKLGVPTISFWGPISPLQRLQDSTFTYYLNKNCSPCIHHTEVIPCGGNNICMKDMQVEEIKTMVYKLIST